MKLIYVAVFAAVTIVSGEAAFAQKNPPLLVCPIEHENTEEGANFDLKKVADSLNYKGKSYKIYTANYPQIVLKEKESNFTVVTVPFDDDIEKPGAGLRRTLRFEKRQINNEGMPELIVHWENWTDNYHSYKGIKVVDLEANETILDQVVFKSIEIPADTISGEGAKKIEFKRYVKLGLGEILVEDVTSQMPDGEENEDSEELTALPSGLYKGGGKKNKFVWSKVPDKNVMASKGEKKDKK